MPTEFADAITKFFQTCAVLFAVRSRQRGQRLTFCKGAVPNSAPLVRQGRVWPVPMDLREMGRDLNFLCGTPQIQVVEKSTLFRSRSWSRGTRPKTTLHVRSSLSMWVM